MVQKVLIQEGEAKEAGIQEIKAGAAALMITKNNSRIRRNENEKEDFGCST